MIRVLISACLLGENVRYDGGSVAIDDPILRRWQAEGRLVPFCPEVAAGLPVPRPPAEMIDARVLARDGRDFTAPYEDGARRALEAAKQNAPCIAVLRDRSPSCGVNVVHDGTFSGTLRPGEGITTALLRRHGIAVFSEDQLADAEKAI
ncbi:MAG TPA: DUF523 domain-containing protein [Bryobacteraceae bacterium]|nr:DUF523 domain-containing protein [Bryobacteraceae bacterium]